MPARQVFDPHRTVVLVKDDPGCQGIQFDAQAVRMLCCRVDHTLAGASTLMAAGRERGQARPLETAAPPPIVWIALPAQQGKEALQRVGGGHRHRARRPQYQAQHFVVAQGFARQRAFGVKPARPAMPGRIDPEPA